MHAGCHNLMAYLIGQAECEGARHSDEKLGHKRHPVLHALVDAVLWGTIHVGHRWVSNFTQPPMLRFITMPVCGSSQAPFPFGSDNVVCESSLVRGR